RGADDRRQDRDADQVGNAPPRGRAVIGGHLPCHSGDAGGHQGRKVLTTLSTQSVSLAGRPSRGGPHVCVGKKIWWRMAVSKPESSSLPRMTACIRVFPRWRN